jgi:hypothetical protein
VDFLRKTGTENRSILSPAANREAAMRLKLTLFTIASILMASALLR